MLEGTPEFVSVQENMASIIWIYLDQSKWV